MSKISPAQLAVLRELTTGRGPLLAHRNGEYEFGHRPFYPRQRRTVQRLLALGLIQYDERETDIQRWCGCRTLGLTEAGRKLVGE